ncbi:MAG: glycosyltransferase family 4 protein [Pseudodesulfovibrio sp.]|nr:glycosyltransferase family 4 protein [Pseudodesulfovibrio sp.]
MHSNEGVRGCGMQRAATSLAEGWVANGHEVTIVTFAPEGTACTFSLDQRVQVRQLDLNRPVSNSLKAAIRLVHDALSIRRALAEIRPHVAVTFGDQTSILTLLGGLFFGVPVIVAERTHPLHYELGRVMGVLRKLLYPWAAAHVAQSEDIAQWYLNNMRVSNVAVIPNTIASPEFLRTPSDKAVKTVIGVGMLAEVKGFPFLINAFAAIASNHPSWQLIIYGEGPDMQALIDLSKKCGVGDRVVLKGWVDDLKRQMSEADMFVLTSRTEGFPNALGEALACGLPAVAFDCPSGPADIIRHGIDGYLVPPGDVEKLALRMNCLMEDRALREEFSASAGDVVERFSLESILERWDLLFDSVRQK